MDLTSEQLLELSFDSAELPAVEMPVDLERRVLAAAADGLRPVRHASWSAVDGAAISALDAFVKTASEFGTLLDTLEPDEWSRRTHLVDVTVRDLVAHLVGVERYVLGQYGRMPALDAPTRDDHWPVTAVAAADVADAPPAVLVRTWWQEVLRVIAAVGEVGPEYASVYHHLAGSTRGLAVVRTFELWTHGDDIRMATFRPLDQLDDARLSLMVGSLMHALPLGLQLSGRPQEGRTARIELTGSGGGTFDVPLGVGWEAGEPDVTLRAEAIRFCRLASNRLTPDDLGMEVGGDASLVEPILVGATAFSAD